MPPSIGMLWLEECINDLYDAGIQDAKLGLIYEANKKNQVAIKTPFGITPRVDINQIVLQGEVLGPLQCSVQVETISKECIEEEKFLYSYKQVNIPPYKLSLNISFNMAVAYRSTPR